MSRMNVRRIRPWSPQYQRFVGASLEAAFGAGSRPRSEPGRGSDGPGQNSFSRYSAVDDCAWPSVGDTVSDTLLIWVKAQSGTRYVVAIFATYYSRHRLISGAHCPRFDRNIRGTTRRQRLRYLWSRRPSLILLASISSIRTNLSRLT